MSETKLRKMKRSPLLVIFTTVFIDLIGFGIVIPVLPFYAEGTRFGATPFFSENPKQVWRRRAIRAGDNVVRIDLYLLTIETRSQI